MPSNNLPRTIFYISVAVFVTGFLLYVAIIAFAPIFLSFLSAIRGVIPPFVVAIAFALLLDPVVVKLQSRGLSRVVATLVVFVVFILIVAAGIISIVPAVISQVGDFTTDLPGYYDRGSEFLSDLAARARPLLSRFHAPTTASEALERFSSQIKSFAGSAANLLLSVLQSTLQKSIWLILIVLITFMLLKDLDKIRGKLIFLLPDAQRERTLKAARAVGNVFARYIRGLVLVCALYGVAAFILFSIFGVRYALLISLAAGLLYAVPYIGPVTTLLIVFLVSLVQRPDHVYIAFIIAGSTLVLNQVFDMLLTPRVLGGAVGLHPVLSIFALTFGGAAYGVAGMILAVPVAASVQVILCEVFPKLREPLGKFDTKAAGERKKAPRRGRRRATRKSE
ncbi:MAG: AI-2E family transporter [Armatimonadota bacterium]|nr:AI-2E family transporter [Armatimonadota bacterium]